MRAGRQSGYRDDSSPRSLAAVGGDPTSRGTATGVARSRLFSLQRPRCRGHSALARSMRHSRGSAPPALGKRSREPESARKANTVALPEPRWYLAFENSEFR